MKIYLLLILLTLLVACGQDNSQEDLLDLQAKHEILVGKMEHDSIMQVQWAEERLSIDSMVQQIEDLKDPEASQRLPGQGGNARLARIGQLKQLLDDKQAKIVQLEEKLATTDSPLLKESILNYKRMLEEKDAEIERLNSTVDQYANVVSNLEEDNSQKERVISQQNYSLQEKEQLLAKREAQLQQQTAAIRTAQQDLARAQRSTSERKVIMAQSLIKAVRSVPGAKPRSKREILDEAWELLCQGHQEQIYQALGMMNELRADRKLGKFVKNKPTCQ